jgi:exodeoxyribonuclease V alpha subunit
MSQLALPAIVRQLSRFLGGNDPTAQLAVTLSTLATHAGHVCADLDRDAGWGPWAGEMDASQRSTFRARLTDLAIVGGADDWTPLVWDGRRLSLRRYWTYEQQVALDLQERTTAPMGLDPTLEAALFESFADAGQRAAARGALVNRLTLISGGPGTGKTTTLARLIDLLCAQAALAGHSAPRIALAAPTGKAAARMAEALQEAGSTIEVGATTLHRLLGMRGMGSNGSGFRHDRERPLAVDVLVVDEASMIDLSLMAHLLAALPATARLIMLGDRDQLAAVEAGAVFADLCASAGLAHCVAPLTTSFRFASTSGIGRLAECLRAGDGTAAVALLQTGADDIDWQAQGSDDRRALIVAAQAGYHSYLEGVAAGLPPHELFACFNRFRVLCAHRLDVTALNEALGAAGNSAAVPVGLPVMVVRNDLQLRLYNGDIGLTLPDPADGSLKVCFPGDTAGAAPRWISFARLPAWEAAWAMTVHKSQGSEFDRVILVLPTVVSPSVSSIATRELIYTGVTRARKHISLWATADVLQAAIGHRAERMSGLREKLAL